MMKKNKALIIILIVILTIIAIALSWFMVIVIKDGKINIKGLNFSNTISNELVLDETYGDIFESIKIDAESAEVYIKESNDDTTTLKIYGEEDLIKVDDKTEKLSIKMETTSCIGFCFNVEVAKIELFLPKSYVNTIKIINEYGNIEVMDFPESSIDIEASAGDVEIGNGNIIRVDNDYGNITIDQANEIDVEASAGNIKVKEVKDAKIKNSYGNIKVDNITNYLNITNDFGNIELKNISLNKNSKIKCDYGDIEIGNTNELYIDATTDLGNVNINNNYNKSEIILKIENDLGNIEVNN